MATQRPPAGAPPGGSSPSGGGPAQQPGQREVELLKVVVTRDGKHVNAQWALHPQMKLDLKPEEWQELSEVMQQVTKIVGASFTRVLDAAEPDKPGTA